VTHRFRTAPRHKTVAAGYGADHVNERARRVKVTLPTDLCGYCRRPLGPEKVPGDKQSRWHLPHNPARTGYLPGMWHRACNQQEGAIRGNLRQRQSLARRRRRTLPGW